MHRTDHSFVLYTPLTREQVLGILQRESGGDSGQTIDGHPVYGALPKTKLEYAETHIKERTDGAEVRFILRLRPWLRTLSDVMRYAVLVVPLLTLIAMELKYVTWHVTAAVFGLCVVYDILTGLVRKRRSRQAEEIRRGAEVLLQCRQKEETTCITTLP
ncbi:MAG: hypothetical protein IJV58_10080 [Oscillospiraceae bacterium]|nr:hypothetical protein [Oscillospiraceae bacterium]